jgi:molybdate transport system substrate-binding protein
MPVLACLTATLLAGCFGGGPTPMSGTVTIFASTSLTDALTGMTRAFSGTYPGVLFQTVLEPDSELAQRVVQGQVPDLIAVEDPTTIAAAGITDEPVHFARGQLVLAVPTANPVRVSQLSDLARPGVRVALCDSAQPCGRIADAVLAAGQVTLGEGALREQDVRAVLDHVKDGTADVALVYRSDALAARADTIMIEVGVSGAALADFVAIVPEGAANPHVARAFLDYLTSQPVLDALTRDGFGPPA